MNYLDEVLESLRRKIKRQQTNLAISQEQLKRIEDMRDAERIKEAKK